MGEDRMNPINSLDQQVHQMLRQLVGVAAVSDGTEVITADVPFKIIHGSDPGAFIIRIKRGGLPHGIGYAQFRREQQLLESTLGNPVGLYLEHDSIVITNPQAERTIANIRRATVKMRVGEAPMPQPT